MCGCPRCARMLIVLLYERVATNSQVRVSTSAQTATVLAAMSDPILVRRGRCGIPKWCAQLHEPMSGGTGNFHTISTRRA